MEMDGDTSPRWGDWTFNPMALSLVLEADGLPGYSINLRSITSSACMLEVIFDLRAQSWVPNDVIADLIAAFQDLFDPRETLCGTGRDAKIDPMARLSTNMIQ